MNDDLPQRDREAAVAARPHIVSLENRYEVLIIDTESKHMTTGDFNLTEQDAIALRKRLNNGNLKPKYLACEIPISHETPPQAGPNEAAPSDTAAQHQAR